MFGMRLTKTADPERVKKCAEMILSSGEYTLVKFATENNLLQNATDIGKSILLECPFHTDYSPSMSIDKDKNIYKCFSCGSSGGYFKFRIEYSEKVKRQSTNYYKVLEDILKSDQNLQLKLGFNTIYRNTDIATSMAYKNRKFNAKALDLTPNNYIELANILKKDKTKSEADYILMISLMQAGVEPKVIYKELYKTTEPNNGTGKDVLNEDDYDFSKYFTN